MKEPVVEVRNLVKEFDGVRALDGLSLEIAPGEVLGLLGANGAGKTTAMYMMMDLMTPSSGEVRIFGKEVHAHRMEILKRVNFSSAYTQLPGNLLVEQNMKVFGHIYHIPNLKERIEFLMETFEITHLRRRVTGQLSAGESTRVALCKAFLNQPDLLLLDEPTASLDPDVADRVRQMILKLHRENDMSILYTSHNMRDIEVMCDRVIFLHKGRIIREGTPREIMDSFAEANMEEVFIRIARGELDDVESILT